MSGETISSGERYWVMYGNDNEVAVLYRATGFLFMRWSNGEWVDASDRYMRITRDAACDEVSLDTAISFMKTLDEKN